jgi:hypothetical protein
VKPPLLRGVPAPVVPFKVFLGRKREPEIVPLEAKVRILLQTNPMCARVVEELVDKFLEPDADN